MIAADICLNRVIICSLDNSYDPYFPGYIKEYPFFIRFGQLEKKADAPGLDEKSLKDNPRLFLVDSLPSSKIFMYHFGLLIHSVLCSNTWVALLSLYIFLSLNAQNYWTGLVPEEFPCCVV